MIRLILSNFSYFFITLNPTILPIVKTAIIATMVFILFSILFTLSFIAAEYFAAYFEQMIYQQLQLSDLEHEPLLWSFTLQCNGTRKM